jgi:ATP-dependent RNA helicase DOB1
MIIAKGIGVHHAGMLPLLKEIIEILFTDGYIKVLFATETVAVGLNMPTKTAVFSDLKKFDGVEKRFITSSEYTQMSGRAGRRGKDDKGHIILFMKPTERPASVAILKSIVMTQPLDLSS